MYSAHDAVDWLGYLTHEEVNFLVYLTRQIDENMPLIVNIGAGCGTSCLAFMSARSDSQVCTIDVQYESSPFGCIEGEINLLKKAGLYDTSRYFYIVGDSKYVAKKWDRPKPNLVFIDGCHSFDCASGDILGWLPLLKDTNSVIAVHDYKKSEKPWPGVDEAVDTHLLNKYHHIATIDTLIAFRNKKLPGRPKMTGDR